MEFIKKSASGIAAFAVAALLIFLFLYAASETPYIQQIVPVFKW